VGRFTDRKQLVTLCRHASLKSQLVNFMGPLRHSLALLINSRLIGAAPPHSDHSGQTILSHPLTVDIKQLNLLVTAPQLCIHVFTFTLHWPSPPIFPKNPTAVEMAPTISLTTAPASSAQLRELLYQHLVLHLYCNINKHYNFNFNYVHSRPPSATVLFVLLPLSLSSSSSAPQFLPPKHLFLYPATASSL